VIQNKVVADLLQHRAMMFALYTGMHREKKGKQQVEKLLVTTLDNLVSSPAMLIHTTVGEDVTSVISLAFRKDGMQFAVPFPSFSIIDVQGEETAVISVRACHDASSITCASFCKRQNKPWEGQAPVLIKAAGIVNGEHAVDVNMLVPVYYKEEKAIAGTKSELHALSNIIIACIGTINAQRAAVAVRMPVAVKPGTSMQAAAKNKSLWEYHEVKLADVPGYIYQPKGGTHASPRWHVRRGHWRQYKTGKRVWIDNMEVGDKALGVVAHDYVVTRNQMEM